MGLGCGLVYRRTCHITATPLQENLRIMLHFFSTLMCVAMNASFYSSSHSFPIDVRDPYWSSGKICDVLDLVENKGLRSSSTLLFACTSLPFSRST